MFTKKEDLYDGVENIKKSPADDGIVELIVCRPEEGERKELDAGELDMTQGLIGDNWLNRGFKETEDGLAHPDMQINLMNSRSIALLANHKDRWKLAGDQFFIDLDLSKDNLPAGTILDIGTAKIVITAEPHLGCQKFSERFGRDAVLFVNSDIGKALNLRGVNAKVLEPGIVRVGDCVKKSEV